MHILLFSEIDPLYSEKNRLHWLLDSLKKHHRVTVVALRDYAKTQQKHTLGGVLVQYLNEEGVSPARVDQFPWMFTQRFHTLVDINTVDVIVSYNGLGFSALLSRVAKRHGIPFCYDLCDDLADLARNSIHVPQVLRPLAGAMARWYLRENVKAAQHLTVTTPLLLEHFALTPRAYSVIPNGYFWEEPSQAISLPAKVPGEVWIVFIGALREWVDFSWVLLDMVRWPAHWKLVIAGNEGDLMRIQSEAEKLGLTGGIHFLGHIPHSALPQLLSQSDVGIIPFRKNATTDMAVPLKLVEYFSCDLPVVATDMLATKAQFGETVHAIAYGDSWLVALEQALSDDTPTSALVQHLSWVELGQRFTKAIEATCS